MDYEDFKNLPYGTEGEELPILKSCSFDQNEIGVFEPVGEL